VLKRVIAWALVLLGLGLLSGFVIRLLWPQPITR
jgi:hypothetical protein